MYRLRRVAPELAFIADSTLVGLDLRVISVDVLEFWDQLRRGDHGSARRLYAGPFLQGVELTDAPEFEAWQEDARQKVTLAAEDMFRRLLHDAEYSADWEAADEASRELLSLNPYDQGAAAVHVAVALSRGEHALARTRLSAALSTLRLVGREPSRRLLDVGRMLDVDSPDDLSESELPLIGREKEFTWLRDYLTQAQSGKGCGLLLAGKAGIGKTRLAQQLIKLAVIRGFRVLTTTGAPILAEIAHSGTRELLARISRSEADRLAPEWKDILAGVLPPSAGGACPPGDVATGTTDRLYEGVCELLEVCSRDRPLLILVEDLQCLDERTVTLLRFLARRLRNGRIILVATARPHEIAGSARQEFSRALQRFDLRELSPEAVKGIIRAFCEREAREIEQKDAEAVERRAGGHPFFVLELLGGWARSRSSFPGEASPGTGSIEQFLDTRLMSLSSVARLCAEALAVLGGAGSAEIVAAVAGVPVEAAVDAAEELGSSGWIRDDPDLHFLHDLVREAAYRGITFARRRLLHCRAARALRADSGDVCEIAVQSDLGNTDDLAYRYGVAAALKVERTLGYASAEKFWVQALRHSKGALRRLHATERLANCYFRARRFSEAERLYRELLHQNLDARRRVIFAARQLRAAASRGSVPEAASTCAALLESAERLRDPGVQLEVARAVVFVGATSTPSLLREAGSFLRRVATMGAQSHDKYDLLETLVQTSWYHPHLGDTSEYLALASNTIVGAAPERVARFHCLRGMQLILAGRPLLSELEYQAAIGLVGGVSRLSAVDRSNHAIVQLELGRIREAQAALGECVRWAEAAEAPHELINFESNLAMAYYEAGAWGDSLSHARRAVACASEWPQPAIHTLAFGLLGLLSLDEDTECVAECREKLEEVEFDALPAGTDLSYAHIFLARLEHREGAAVKALARLDAAIGGFGRCDALARARLQLEKARHISQPNRGAALALAREVRNRALENDAVLLLNKSEALIRELKKRVGAGPS